MNKEQFAAAVVDAGDEYITDNFCDRVRNIQTVHEIP